VLSRSIGGEKREGGKLEEKEKKKKKKKNSAPHNSGLDLPVEHATPPLAKEKEKRRAGKIGERGKKQEVRSYGVARLVFINDFPLFFVGDVRRRRGRASKRKKKKTVIAPLSTSTNHICAWP